MSPKHDSDKNWERLGEIDPYFAVLTKDDYKHDKLDELARDKFFATGQAHVQQVMTEIQSHLDPTFTPRRALDFGCGVGRLVVPLAAICASVVGVDISDAMLAEARRNCDAHGASNVDLIKSDDGLTQVKGGFDFIHSYIVLQHIQPKRGERVIRRLVELLTDNGVGVLHVTYHRQSSTLSRWIYWVKRTVPGANTALNILQKRPASYPLMEMNEYNLASLFVTLHQANCLRTYVRYTREISAHTQTYGMVLFFQKSGTEM